jgi:hypothetical protein
MTKAIAAPTGNDRRLCSVGKALLLDALRSKVRTAGTRATAAPGHVSGEKRKGKKEKE